MYNGIVDAGISLDIMIGGQLFRLCAYSLRKQLASRQTVPLLPSPPPPHSSANRNGTDEPSRQNGFLHTTHTTHITTTTWTLRYQLGFIETRRKWCTLYSRYRYWTSKSAWVKCLFHESFLSSYCQDNELWSTFRNASYFDVKTDIFAHLSFWYSLEKCPKFRYW